MEETNDTSYTYINIIHIYISTCIYTHTHIVCVYVYVYYYYYIEAYKQYVRFPAQIVGILCTNWRRREVEEEVETGEPENNLLDIFDAPSTTRII